MKTQQWYQNILEYIKEVKWAALMVVITVLMTHGSLLFSDSIGIDTEIMIEGVHNFDQIGRQGLVWLGKLLGLGWFNLYYAQVLTLLFMILIPLAFGYLFQVVGNQQKCNNLTLLVLGLSFAVSPFWTVQIYFLNQSAQVTCGCLLLPVSIILAERGRKFHKWVYIVLAVLFMQLSFSSYQVMPVIYTVGVSAMFLLSSLQEERTKQQQFQWLTFHIIIFAISAGVYVITSKLFFMKSGSYLESQIHWGRQGIAEGLGSCIEAIKVSLGNNPPYYTGFYGVFAGLLLFVTIFQAVTRRKVWKGNTVLFVLAEIYLIVSPFIFIFLYGGPIMDRMQLVMPISQGCILYVTIMLMCVQKDIPKIQAYVYRGISILLVAAIYKNTITQMSYSNRFYYTEQYRFQYDRVLAHDIYEDVNNVLAENGLDGEEFDNILFVGYPDLHYNQMCITGEVMGKSSFAYGIVKGSINRGRITYFMRGVGYPIRSDFTKEETATFLSVYDSLFAEKIEEMPIYPGDGYVQFVADKELNITYLVVKLGEDWRGFDPQTE